ncbi:MAG TPA: SDR family NAD(P)-dependent oxidoreductase [Caulobacteraceae bacterium]|nr:SDR family NAD(P)-dependent oxidoreductase [Caulobacteraceae bacterium]
MPRTIVIVGYGPGVSNAVAERFGAEGFSCALVARTAAKLEVGVAALEAKGVTAAAFAADAAHPAAIVTALRDARARLGPIGAIHWNAYPGGEAGDLMAVEPAAIGKVFDVAVTGLVAAVQEALSDLKADGRGAVLVTNGAFGELGPAMDGLAVRLNAMGLAVANAAKTKLAGLLSERLRGDGVFVGEVMIAGAVKGTGFDRGGPAIDPAVIAQKFWDLYQARAEIRARVS